MITVETAAGAIPALGLGTWQLRGHEAQRMVENALAMGYRHIDTAQAYGNEAEVGAAIAASGIAREELWLTSKIWPDQFAPPAFEAAAEERARLLGTPPDLLLLHWPSREVPLEETIPALNRAQERGLTRSIGVSNFPVALIEAASRLSALPLVCDQVEYHPFLSQGRVLEACRARGMAVTAYCPLARGRVLEDETLTRIAESHGKSATQVTLRWLVQQPGVCAIPRTSSEANARSNLAIFDFVLSDGEMNEIGALGRAVGRICDYPHLSPVWDPVD